MYFYVFLTDRVKNFDLSFIYCCNTISKYIHEQMHVRAHIHTHTERCGEREGREEEMEEGEINFIIAFHL